MTPEEKTKEIVMVRGIAASLQAMHSPTINSLNFLLEPYGLKVTKLDSTNKQNEQ